EAILVDGHQVRPLVPGDAGRDAGRGHVPLLALGVDGPVPGERQIHLPGGADRGRRELPVTPEPVQIRRHGSPNTTEPPLQVFDVQKPAGLALIPVVVEGVANAATLQGDLDVAHASPAPRSAKTMSPPKRLPSRRGSSERLSTLTLTVVPRLPGSSSEERP